MTQANHNGRSIADQISEALECYERSIIPRAAVAAIPHIGGSIDRLLSGRAARRWQERVMSLIEELRVRFDKIEESYIDKEFLNSDEFEELIIRVFQALQSTHEHEKIAYFAQVLSKVVTTPLLRDERAQRYIMLVDDLTGLHIRIIKLFAERRQSSIKKGRPEDVVILRAKEIAESLGGSQEEIEAFCSDLVARSLLYDPQLGLVEYQRGSYALHPSAFPFIDFLDLSASEASKGAL